MNDDRGAVMVIVAVSMVLLVGMAAFVVDLGAMYQERRELQNGADAAALAIAEDCALGLASCGGADATAAAYADVNAGDGASTVDDIDLDLTAKRVTVDVSTSYDGGSSIPFRFAQVFGFDGSSVGASATVQWGGARSLQTLPLVISDCEVPDSATFLPRPPGAMGDEVTLRFHASDSTDKDEGAPDAGTCHARPGMDIDGDGKLPAGFGWVVGDSTCLLTTVADPADDGSWAVKDPGVNPECGVAGLEELIGTTIALPVFVDFCRSTEAACPSDPKGDKYRIDRYEGFYVTGYDLGGPKYERFGPPRAAAPDCGTASQSDHCLSGFFTRMVTNTGEPGGPDSSVIVIRLTR